MDECKPLNEGTCMSSIDLMRAAVPVFQPVNSTHIRSGFLGRCLHSFPFPLNLSLLFPFPLNSSFLCPPYTPNWPWMCPEGAQVEL